jgi:hypothetical protein
LLSGFGGKNDMGGVAFREQAWDEWTLVEMRSSIGLQALQHGCQQYADFMETLNY